MSADPKLFFDILEKKKTQSLPHSALVADDARETTVCPLLRSKGRYSHMHCTKMAARYPLAIRLKCDHTPLIKAIGTFPANWSMVDVFNDFHPEYDIKNYHVTASGSASTIAEPATATSTFELQWRLTVEDLNTMGVNGIKNTPKKSH